METILLKVVYQGVLCLWPGPTLQLDYVQLYVHKILLFILKTLVIPAFRLSTAQLLPLWPSVTTTPEVVSPIAQTENTEILYPGTVLLNAQVKPLLEFQITMLIFQQGNTFVSLFALLYQGSLVWTQPICAWPNVRLHSTVSKLEIVVAWIFVQPWQVWHILLRITLVYASLSV